ncbi:helix-turn-helix domain-containing protein [Streptomyces anulatus]|uniref:helix-turn-helix domain-containing protein n=1 Tax=Streptomyces anulatus TaxID=1892 RepID=UPI00386BE22C
MPQSDPVPTHGAHHARASGNAHPSVPPNDLYQSVHRAHFRCLACLGSALREPLCAPRGTPCTQRRRLNTHSIRRYALRAPNERRKFCVVTPNGAAIRSFREKCGLSLTRLARLIDHAPSHVSRIEREQRGAAEDTLRQIAEVLQVPIAAITREKPRDQE